MAAVFFRALRLAQKPLFAGLDIFAHKLAETTMVLGRLDEKFRLLRRNVDGLVFPVVPALQLVAVRLAATGGFSCDLPFGQYIDGGDVGKDLFSCSGVF